MSKLQPLTAEEQKMAADYFYLVDRFLRRKRLDPNEYYDVAIFGYLEAIQRECRNQNPPENKNIYALIEVCMDCAVRYVLIIHQKSPFYRFWRRGNAAGTQYSKGRQKMTTMPNSEKEVKPYVLRRDA